jgi:hypothetical protein
VIEEAKPVKKQWKAAWFIGIAALGVLGVVAAAGQAKPATSPAERPTVTMNAVWDFKPASLAEARAAAQQIVSVTVVSVAAGPDIVTPAKGEPDGVDRIPTQRVVVQVTKAYKGTAKVGDQLTLFQTGGLVSTAVPGDTHPRLVVDGDPFYAAGEQYVLMLVPGPQGTLRIISPEGRYKIDAKGTLSSATHGSVVDQVKAKGLAAFTG